MRACLEIAERIGFPWSSPAPWRPRLASEPGWRWRPLFPELPYACGLNTVPLLIDDLVESSLVATGGYLQLGDLVVDPLRLSKTAAPMDVADAWRARLRDVRRAMPGMQTGEGRVI